MTAAETQPNPLLTLRRAYSDRARNKRAQMFRSFFPDLRGEAVLDLGGGKGEHIARVLPGHANITIADYDETHLEIARTKFGYRCVRMDGAERLQFDDGAFDIVYCNSVIEHVTGPRDIVLNIREKSRFEAMGWEHQQRFAAEIRRIAKSYFVQTPYKWFPIESHTITPSFVQWLPRPAQLACYRAVPKKRTTPDFRLLTISEMRRLFPDADIVFERSLGMVKSIIAVKRG
jgi:ubiquinone/menaquinone biosynthesis C-methylase UbiE